MSLISLSINDIRNVDDQTLRIRARLPGRVGPTVAPSFCYKYQLMMDSTSVFSMVQMMQSALKVLALLQFTAYMWPKQAIVNDGATFDFIIVGAGTAGSVIANRLTENPDVQVLLIEAGGNPPLESDISSTILYLKQSRYDWNFTSENYGVSDQCHQKSTFEMTQGKMLGGTSSLNYLVYARGYPIDFESWAEISKEKSWGWDNVLEAYIKSEKCKVSELLNSPNNKYHGTKGYLGVTKESSGNMSNYLNAFKEIGFKIVPDYNPENPLGYSDYMVMIADGHRQSSATAYLTPIKDRPNLHVMKETTVTKIIIKDNKATGVEARRSDGKIFVINAEKEVIVSAGALNSPKLLMLSGIGPKEHLISKGIDVVTDLPVGQNLQDHVSVILIHTMHDYESLAVIDPHLFPATTFRGFIALDKNQQYPDYGVNNFVVGEDIVLHFCSFAYRFKHKICDEIYKAGKGKIAVFNQVIHLAPKSRGKVLLRSSDPADDPIIYTGQFSNPEDLDLLVKYVEDLAPVINSTYYRSVNAKVVDPLQSQCKEFEADSSEYWRCYTQCISTGMGHFSSTVSMGKVLDGRLNVHGITGLRVADASVMPSIPRANPAATVIVIGEIVSDFIKKDYNL